MLYEDASPPFEHVVSTGEVMLSYDIGVSREQWLIKE